MSKSVFLKKPVGLLVVNKKKESTYISVPWKQDIIFKKQIFPKKLLVSQLGICNLKIHHSEWDLDYVMPKEISKTSLPNPKYIF